jgi:putative restriction endonuclease
MLRLLPHPGVTLWESAYMAELSDDEVLELLATFRQYQHNGKRVPHKPLLVLLALGRLDDTGTSALPWSEAETRLADLIAEFGPPSRTGRPQSAAYPFTRLRADGIWEIDHDVPDDNLGPLREQHVIGQLSPELEQSLCARPLLLRAAARRLVESQFPLTVAVDVLTAVGLDPNLVFGSGSGVLSLEQRRRRSSSWPQRILAAWDRQCAFCGYDGQLAGTVVGIEAAHVRWFNLGGPDSDDNGMALCSLHHKLFDRGAVGLDHDYRIHVSDLFSARTEAAKRHYELHDKPLNPRRGTKLPAAEYVTWHTTQVFKGEALSA